MDLVFELIYLSAEKLHEHLDIRIQLFVPIEKRFKWATLDTFDASWDQVLIIIG